MRPRQDTGLQGAAKRKQDRIKDKPLKARRDYQRDNKRNDTKESPRRNTNDKGYRQRSDRSTDNRNRRSK